MANLPPQEPRAPDPDAVRITMPGGRVVEISRKDALRLAMGHQLARRIQELVATVHRNEKGDPIDLMINPQWGEIYADGNPDMDIVSPAQFGKSIYMILRLLAGGTLGLSSAMILPTDDARNRMVKEKVDPIIECVPYYAEQMLGSTGTGSVRLKRFGKGADARTLYFINSESQKECIAFTTDVLNVDEYDFCNRGNVGVLPARMNRSEFRLRLNTSTPTLPGDAPGSTSAADKSDNICTNALHGTDKHYMTCCPHCDFVQELVWEQNVVKENVDENGRLVSFEVLDQDFNPDSHVDLKVCCANPKCKRPFDRARAKARWIARRPQAKSSSYWINRLNSPLGDPLKTLLLGNDQYAMSIGNPTKMQAFYNMNMGRAFAAGHMRFTEDLFRRCIVKGWRMRQTFGGPVAVGIDVNQPYFDIQADYWFQEPLHGKFERIKVFAGKVAGEENVYPLVEGLGAACVCIDQQPELNTAYRMKEEFEKRGIYCILAKASTHPLSKLIIESTPGDTPMAPPQQVTFDRVAGIDDVYSDMQRMKLGWFEEWAEAIDGRLKTEFTKPVRAISRTDEGDERYTWIGKPDHQLSACVLAKLAGTLGNLQSRAMTEVLFIRQDFNESEEPDIQSEGDAPDDDDGGDSSEALIFEDLG